MKKLTLGALLLLVSFNSFALESGKYINKTFTEADPFLYKSVELDSSTCKSGGVVAKFYNADPFNFCAGYTKKSVYTYKKCFGKEISVYPIMKKCIGVKREVEQVTTLEVMVDAEKKALILFERSTDDNVVVFEQEHQLIDLGNGRVKLEHSFNSIHDGRTGGSEYFFDKN